jgi:hypothetical protein
LLGINFIFVTACGEAYKIYILTLEYKENLQVRLSCSQCADLAHAISNKAGEFWLTIMENIPQNEKLTLFLAYYVQQLMKNQNDLIEMWNINKHPNRI